jgi:signal transduction histidine kinase
MTRHSWSHATIRVRLTAHYALAFFLAGATLITAQYVYMGYTLDHERSTNSALTDQVHQWNATHSDKAYLPAQLQAQLHAQFEQDRGATTDTMLGASLLSLLLVGLIAAGFGWLSARRALRPLQRITATARRVADRNLHERIALTGPDDEIKDLADTFDAMLARLDRGFDSQRRFVANAAHELRTPLTLNRTVLEVALDDPQAPDAVRELGASLLAVNQRHERLIDGLLTLASSEHGLVDPVPLDLADAARQVTAELDDRARTAGIDLRSDLQPAHVTGDPVLLERLVHNLLDNAIRYNTPERGHVTITTDSVAGAAVLCVDNTGPSIAEQEVPGIFEPLRRLGNTDRLAEVDAPTGRGAGLGLSIVRAVTEAHGGQVQARPRTGGGLLVRVTIPADAMAERERRQP